MKKFNIYFYGFALLCVYLSLLGCVTYEGDSRLLIEANEANNKLSSINSAVATPTVEFNNLILRKPRAIALDAVNGRALVVDSALGAVVAVDLLAGTHTMLSDAATPNTANPLRTPSSIALDAANNRALVLDDGLKAVVAVDLETGVRTILSDATTPNAVNLFEDPESIVLDAVNDRALVLDSRRDAVVAVDLTTGLRTILSYVSNMPRFGDIALDSANGRVLVANSSLGVEVVELKTGTRSFLSKNTANSLPFPTSIALDEANNRALVVSYGWGGVVAVDLTTGTRTIFSPKGVSLWDMVLDADRGRVLALDFKLGVVVALDLKDGVRTILSDIALPNAANPFRAPASIALDAANNRALVVDYGLSAVVAVNLNTGARTILSDAKTPNTVNPFKMPQGIALDVANGRALVVNSPSRSSVMAVDLKTGARTILSDSRTPDAVNRIHYPRSITLDAVNGRALVMDYGMFGRSAVMTVNLKTGARTILSGKKIPNRTNRFRTPKSSALDVANDRALVVDSGLNAVVAVDLKTGVRTILSDATTPNAANLFSALESIALDAANDRALVVDSGLDAVVAVDLKTGARTILSDAGTPNAANLFGAPKSIALDIASNRALVLDRGLNAVMAVDLKTGARTILSGERTPSRMGQAHSTLEEDEKKSAKVEESSSVGVHVKIKKYIDAFRVEDFEVAARQLTYEEGKLASLVKKLNKIHVELGGILNEDSTNTNMPVGDYGVYYASMIPIEKHPSVSTIILVPVTFANKKQGALKFKIGKVDAQQGIYEVEHWCFTCENSFEGSGTRVFIPFDNDS